MMLGPTDKLGSTDVALAKALAKEKEGRVPPTPKKHPVDHALSLNPYRPPMQAGLDRDTDLLCAATILAGILQRTVRSPSQDLATQVWDYVQCLKDEQNRRLNEKGDK